MPSHQVVIWLTDGRSLTINGFKDVDEMVRFSTAIDPDMFKFHSIEIEPAETVQAN